MQQPSWLGTFRVCAWPIVALDAGEIAALTAAARGHHAQDAIVQSCQRLEAYGFDPCTCDAPLRLLGLAALERLAAVAAGIDSVVLGEAQIMGQVRHAFRPARGPLRAAGDLALAAAREARRRFPERSHAGHLLDRALSTSGMEPYGRLLVLGTGTMGRLVAQRARDLGFVVTIAGRRDPGLGIRFVALEELEQLGATRVIVGCLGSGAGIIDPRAFPPAELLVDLGTPRNFASVCDIPVIRLSDLLAAEDHRPHAAALRARCRCLVTNSLYARLATYTEDSNHPVGRFRLAMEEVRRQALERALASSPEADRTVVDHALRSAVNRLLHEPTTRLRRAGNDQCAALLAETAEAIVRAEAPIAR